MKRSTVRLTDRLVRSLRPRAAAYAVHDADLPGFGVRVLPSGVRSFFLRYGPGHDRRASLGVFDPEGFTLAKARAKARDLVNRIGEGADPSAEKRAQRAGLVANTFGELAALYLERHAKRHKRSWREDERMLERNVLPLWRDRPLAELRRRDVIALVDAIADGKGPGRRTPGKPAPVAAARVLALVSKAFSFAVERELVDANPAYRVSRARQNARERVLTGDELRAVWRALDAYHPVTAAAWRLILLTAQRPGEVARMRWADLVHEPDGWWWSQPAEHMKGGIAHRVPLSREAAAIVEELRPLTGSSPWVLASRYQTADERDAEAARTEERRARVEELAAAGKRPRGAPFGNRNRQTHGRYAGQAVEGTRYTSPHLTRLQSSSRRLLEATGVPHFTPHDLRRTAATIMASAGVLPHIVDRVLAHKARGITPVYQRASYGPEMRQALTILGDRVRAAVAGDEAPASNVVRIG